MQEASDRLLNGRYEVLGVAGSGGEATVLRAIDRRHDRLVALKRRRISLETTDQQQPFLLEARTLLSLRPHRGLPLARDDFFEDEFYFLVLDWVDGVDLATFVAEQGRPGVPLATVLRWMAPVAAALGHLHQSEPPIVHGDVKPANLILTSAGDVVLVDFGMSSASGDRGRGGTPGFRPPDAIAATPTPAVDVYGLAATVFALLTGAPPSGVLPDWGNLDLQRAARLEAALRRGMAIDPSRRTTTPGTLIEELRSGLDDHESLATGVLTYLSSDAPIPGQLWQEHPHLAISLRAEHMVLVDRVLEDHGGRQVGAPSSDGEITAVFGRPIDATEAAIALQRAATEGSVPTRCALDTGDYIADAGYVGATHVRVNRIREEALPGQILLSEATERLTSADLSDGATTVDLGPHRLAGFDRPTPLFAIAARGIVAPRDPGVSPYPGLATFQPDEAELFFGREEIIADLADRMELSRLVAVVGASGSGKSSLLRAGLAPQLPGSVIATPTEHPLRVLDSIDDDTPLIVDQFEELFSLCSDTEEVSAFIAQLLTRRGPCVIAVRADRYGSLARHAELAKLVSRHQVLLGAMTEEQLRRAISAPAIERGLEIEPGLVDLVVAEVRGEPGVLPHMAHALRETWLRRDGRTLTVAGYLDSGGVRGALTQTAETLYTESDPGNQALFRSLMLSLVEVGDGLDVSRRRASIAELAEMPNGARLAPLMERLAASRLITIESDSVEPAHEALLRDWPRLSVWIDDARDDLRIQRSLGLAAAEWQRSDRDPAHLFRGSKLAHAAEWSSAHGDDVGSSEADFLEAGRQLEQDELSSAQRTSKRLRRLLVAAVVLLVAALAASTFAFVQGDHADKEAARAKSAAAAAETAAAFAEDEAARADGEAERADGESARANDEAERATEEAARATEQADVATAKSLAAQATSLAPTDADLSLLLAVEGFRRDDSLDTRSGLLTALDASRHITGGLVEGLPDTIVDAVYSVKAQAMFVLDGDAVLSAIDPSTGAALAEPVTMGVGAPVALGLSSDGAMLAVNGQADIVLFDTETKQVVASGLGGDGQFGLLSDDNSQLIAMDRRNGRVAVVDVASGAVVARHDLADPNAITAAGFLPDGTVILTWGITVEHLAIANGALVSIAEAEIPASTGWVASPDGSVLATGGLSGEMVLLDTTTLEPIAPAIRLSASRSTSANFSPDGSLVAVGGDDGSATVISALDGRVVRRVSGLRGFVLTAFASNTELISISAVEANGFVTDLERPTILGDSAKVTESAYWIEPFDDGYLVQDRFEMRFVGPDGESRQVISTDSLTVSRYFDVGTDHDLLVTTGTRFSSDFEPGPSFVEIRRLTDAEVVHTIGNLPAAASRVEISPDGSMAAVGFTDGTLVVYDTATADVVFDGGIVDQLEFAIATVVWTAGGTRLMVGGQDGHVYTFETTGWTKVNDTELAAGIAVRYAEVSPDGTLVAVPVEVGQLFLLAAGTGEIVAGPLDAGGTQLQHAVVLADNRTVVASSRDGALRLWDVATGRAIGPALHGDDVFVEAFAEIGGEVISVGAASGTAITWDLDAEHWVDLACRLAGRNLTEGEWATYVGDDPFRNTCA